jgi:hypothetical protein
MVDTPRTQAALITASADNTTGNYNNQNQRDFIVSVLNVVPAVVSAAGTTQANATVLTAQSNIVTVCAAGAGVVATAGYTKVYNRAANAVLVYPISSAQFEGLGTIAPVSIPVGGQAEFFMTSSTQGYVG